MRKVRGRWIFKFSAAAMAYREGSLSESKGSLILEEKERQLFEKWNSSDGIVISIRMEKKKCNPNAHMAFSSPGRKQLG